jgi:hypothetical protein
VKNARTSKKFLALVGGAALGVSGWASDAGACGCFTPPDPSVPVVQAGERIAFAQSNGQVTAHIQISYQGNAQDFGWLLPLPSVPTLTLGVDELFNQLTSTTQPKYKMNKVYEGNCSFDPSRFGGGGGFAGAPTANGAGGGSGDTAQNPSPLVIQSSIGPYDYAVLKADSQDAMLNWLTTNHYFVPAGTTDSVSAYIHPGAFFLALKLKSGASAGDLQPVVVNYASDLPMIPIVLTSTGAKPDMGIQVWMLGAGRAIPRNYYHTVIDDALIDWTTAGQNYNDVIIKATHEADGRHTFVTEYAGTSSVMKNVLNAPGRFGVQTDLAAQTDAQSFVDYMFAHQFGQAQNNQGGGPIASFGQQLTSQELSILGNYIPVPPALLQKGIQPQNFYQSIDYYLGSYRQQFPNDFAGWTMNYQPTMMAQDLWDRVVTPTLQAGALFDQFPYLTRLYTTLSPEDMNKDPVFSWNPTLPDWPNEHDGTLTYHCGYFGRDSVATTPATLVTAAGWVIQYPYGTGTPFTPPDSLPASQYIQILAEEGDPQVVTDNTGAIKGALPMGSGGCGVSMGSRATETAGGLVLMLFAGTMLIVSRRRRSA